MSEEMIEFLVRRKVQGELSKFLGRDATNEEVDTAIREAGSTVLRAMLQGRKSLYQEFFDNFSKEKKTL